ncbi:MAG: DUF2314 domain-containing protein [Pseudomonadota bacterium]
MAVGLAGMVYAGVMLSTTGRGPADDQAVAEAAIDAAEQAVLADRPLAGSDAPTGSLAGDGAGTLTDLSGADDGADGRALDGVTDATGTATSDETPTTIAAAPAAPSPTAQPVVPVPGGGAPVAPPPGLPDTEAPSFGVLSAPSSAPSPGLAPQPTAVPGPAGTATVTAVPTPPPGSEIALAPSVPEIGVSATDPAGGATRSSIPPGTGTVAAITPDLGEPTAAPSEAERVIDALRPDPIMTAAILRARQTLPDILDQMITPPLGTAGYSIKVAVPTENDFEQMWMDNCQPAGLRLMCQAANDGVETGLKIGDPYSVEVEMIADWMYLEGDGIHGGYTLRLMLQQMAPEQADALRSRLRPLPG